MLVSLQANLLRSKLMELLDNFLQPAFTDPAGLMKIMGHLLHCLGAQGIGIVSLKIARHLLRLFTDVSWTGELGWQDSTGQGCREQSEASTCPQHHPQNPPENKDSVDCY